MDDPAALREVCLQAGVPAAVVDAGLRDPAAAALIRAALRLLAPKE